MCLYLAESIATCFMPIKNLYCIVYFSRWWLASSNISVKFCFRACFPGKQNMIPSICRLLNLPRVCLLLKYWQSPYYRPLSPTLALLLFNFYCIHVWAIVRTLTLGHVCLVKIQIRLRIRILAHQWCNFFIRTTKTLIRLRGCAGCSESRWAHISEGTFFDLAGHKLSSTCQRKVIYNHSLPFVARFDMRFRPSLWKCSDPHMCLLLCSRLFCILHFHMRQKWFTNL